MPCERAARGPGWARSARPGFLSLAGPDGGGALAFPSCTRASCRPTQEHRSRFTHWHQERRLHPGHFLTARRQPLDDDRLDDRAPPLWPRSDCQFFYGPMV
ncbi:hypothetical protein [Armatimonas sp.]|uniref:hypothetical protein n=1 Tax=Armatimonas sp. TaxID=1872638 RepID=UPI003750C8A7